MFRKLLIANRGEVALRVIRACRLLGVSPVAVCSDADRASPHVRLADEVYPLGGSSPEESYLCAERILEAAARCGAEAIHPGYGFLAESEDFARRCAEAGLAFVGPSAEVLRLVGNKVAAREAARAARVPCIPGYEGGDDGEALVQAAERLGYPVLIKAARGGGGRGMRRAEDAASLRDALPGARHEARLAFGEGRLYLEKLLERPRHIEVQLLGDGRGGAVHLLERECSLQRRHQKVVEECPAPGLGEGLRGRLRRAALKLARAVGYGGAGTAEFLVTEEGSFYFLEVNARLQVEHPVSEMVTGVDIVAWQLRLAAGEPLSLRQQEVRPRGHSVEARLYAEDPERDFLPQSGRVGELRLPSGPGVRVETALEAGAQVSPHYDPLLAKVVAWGEGREEARRRLAAALDELVLTGITTNLELLRRAVRDPDFAAGHVHTASLERILEGLRQGAGEPPDEAILAAALVEGRGEGGPPPGAPGASGGAVPPSSYDPWRQGGPWRIGGR